MAAQTSSRKQWRICRGPKGNVQSLGWAEFGCPDSQVKLAKELLQDNGEEREEREEKARLGVYWLLKASETGHGEATALLSDCLAAGTGITEHNMSDVKLCLEMPKGEKLSREAAKELFLSLAQGENYITSNQLVKEISKFSDGASTSRAGRVEDWREWSMGEKLSEEEMIGAGGQHLRGELPGVLREELDRDRPPGAFISRRLASVPLLPPPYLAVALLSLAGPLYILDSLPSILYYFSLCLMILSTSSILSNKWEFDQFKWWSRALVAWGCTEEVSTEAQWAHCSARSTPFLVFLLSLVVHIISSTYIVAPPNSEIATLSTLLSLYILYNFTWKRKKIDSIGIVAFIVHLVARYPYEVDTFVYHYWRYLDVHVPTFTSYALGSSIEFCLNVRVVLYLMLPGIFIKMASRDRWLGIYTSLLPLLVSLAWSQLALSASKDASEFGVSRAVLGFVLLGVFLPLSSATLLLLPIFAISKFLITEQVSLNFAISSLSLITFIHYTFKYKAWKRMLCFLQILLCIASVYALLTWGEMESIKESRGLDWRELGVACSRSDLASQEECARFAGLEVSGTGRVLSTSIASVQNPAISIIQHLPANIQGPAVCLLGEKLERCKNDEDCNRSWKNCRLSNWNKYEYDVELETETGEEAKAGWSVTPPRPVVVRLRGGTSFRNFSIALAYGDYISFTGVVSGEEKRGDRSQPVMMVREASCLECVSPVRVYRQPTINSILCSFLKTIFNFLFQPVAILNIDSLQLDS